MSGSRTKTGCYSCRIRKKKCDEEKPFCLTCRSREIVCYGYGAKPEWMNGMGSWKEVMESKEAGLIREGAETTYKLRRRKRRQLNQGTVDPEAHESQELNFNSTNGTTSVVVQDAENEPTQLVHSSGFLADIQGHTPSLTATSILQIHSVRSTIPVSIDYIPSAHLSSPTNLRLLMTFLDVIFPLQYGSFSESTKTDRNWLFHTLVENEPFYQASASIAASLESRMHNGLHNTTSDLDPAVRKLQSKALKGLQCRIGDLTTEKYHGKELLKRGMQALAIMTELLSLEIFNFAAGQWEMHLQASRTLLGMFQHKWAPEIFSKTSIASNDSEIDLKALEFFITSFVWVDIIANATLGPPEFNARHFDYLPLLKMGVLRPQDVMGCQSCIMVSITEITDLERWKEEQVRNGCLSVMQLASRAAALNDSLVLGIASLELRLTSNIIGLKADSQGVNLVFAYAALVYLHTLVSGASPYTPEIKHNVTRCLECIEALQPHLIIRICWPFTIAGCMATEEQYDRFRSVLARTSEEGQHLGSTWKGLKVMEECWRLRKVDSGRLWYWRSTMERMGLRVLLT